MSDDRPFAHENIRVAEDLDRLDKEMLIGFLNSDREDKISLLEEWRTSSNWKDVDLEGANLRNSHLEGADLGGAYSDGKWTHVNLQQANLEFAHLEGADLVAGYLEGANLNGAYLNGANLTEARLGGAQLIGANMEGANLSLADLQRANLHGANLQEANLVAAHLEGADLTKVHLEGVDLTEAHLEGANLTEAHLEGAYLVDAHLEGANLNGAHLEGAHPSGAHLEGVSLRLAHLEGTYFLEAHLDGTELFMAHLEGALVNQATLQGADLRLAYLRDVALSSLASGGLREVKLYQTYFWGVLSLRYEQFLEGEKSKGESTIWEDTQGRFTEAKDIYKTLKGYFEDVGDYEGANWAYQNEQKMEKLMYAPTWAHRFYPRHQWQALPYLYGEAQETFWKPNALEWLRLELSDKLAGYGLNLARPLIWLGIIILLFAFIYLIGGMVTMIPGCGYADGLPTSVANCVPTYNPVHTFLFSFGALTNTQIGKLRPYREYVGILTTIEVLLGIALTGLFGFVLGNKLRNS